MKEFGLDVSSDHVKMFKMLGKYGTVLGFMDRPYGPFKRVSVRIVHERIGPGIGIRIYRFHYDNTTHIGFDMLDELMAYLKDRKVTFIDPETPKGNDIFYTDGTQVNVGDDCKIKLDNKSFLDERIGTYRGCLSFDRQDTLFRPHPQPIINCDYIIWERNRMVNVAKVEG